MPCQNVKEGCSFILLAVIIILLKTSVKKLKNTYFLKYH